MYRWILQIYIGLWIHGWIKEDGRMVIKKLKPGSDAGRNNHRCSGGKIPVFEPPGDHNCLLGEFCLVYLCTILFVLKKSNIKRTFTSTRQAGVLMTMDAQWMVLDL